MVLIRSAIAYFFSEIRCIQCNVMPHQVKEKYTYKVIAATLEDNKDLKINIKISTNPVHTHTTRFRKKDRTFS